MNHLDGAHVAIMLLGWPPPCLDNSVSLPGTPTPPQALRRPHAGRRASCAGRVPRARVLVASRGSERPEDVRDDGVVREVGPLAVLGLCGLLRRVHQVVLEHGVDGRVAGLDVLRRGLEGRDLRVQQVGALQLEHRQVAAACGAQRAGRGGWLG